MAYLDANVFIFAASDQGNLGIAAREIILEVQRGKREAITSALTYDEVVWGVRKILNKEKAYLAGELFLALPHLTLAEANRQTLSEAHHLIKHLNLKPRDAIHLATMHLHHEQIIVSEDPDFDHIPGIKRISLEDFSRCKN